MEGSTAFFLVFLAITLSVAGLSFFFMLTRHRERTQMLEKGADASLFQTQPRKKNFFISLLIGLVFVAISVGIGLGFLISQMLYNANYLKYSGNPGPYFFSIFLMIGVAFISAYFLHKRLRGQE